MTFILRHNVAQTLQEAQQVLTGPYTLPLCPNTGMFFFIYYFSQNIKMTVPRDPLYRSIILVMKTLWCRGRYMTLYRKHGTGPDSAWGSPVTLLDTTHTVC